MSRRTWVWALGGLCGLMLNVAWVSAQEKKPGEEPKQGQPPKKVAEGQKPEAGQGEKPEAAQGEAMAELIKKWAEYANPGENHKRLEPLVGKWDYEMKMWMDPQAEPQLSKGTSESKWLFDGRYLQQEFTCAGEGPEGKSFRGLGLCAYDNMKKQYVSVWLDNMGTGIMIGYGTYDPGTKDVVYKGECADPMTGQMNQKWRGVGHIENNDKHTYTMYVTGPDGKEFKMMEINYSRAK